MDHQTYPSRQAALDAVEQLMGWSKARPVKRYLPNELGNYDDRWCLQVEDSLYMRQDGYVR
jgi:hypothetical protein